MQKKIVVIGPISSIHFYRWCLFLKSLNYKVYVISLFYELNANFDYKQFSGFLNLSRFRKSQIGKIVHIIKLFSYLLKNKIDIVSLHYLNSFYALFYLFWSKVILTCWGSDILEDYKIAKRFKRFLYHLVFKKSKWISSNSSVLLESIQMKYKKIKNKLCEIHFGVKVEYFNLASETERNILRKKYQIPEKAIVLLSMRVLHSYYNIHKLILSFRKNIKNPNIYFFIRIAPNSVSEYVLFCKKLSFGDLRIKFNSELINYPKTAQFHKLADMILSFPVNDSTGVSNLEAISSGNLMIGANWIRSYKKLSDIYKICLIDKISDLNSTLIVKLMTEKKKYSKLNRQKLLTIHNEVICLKYLNNKLNELF